MEVPFSWAKPAVPNLGAAESCSWRAVLFWGEQRATGERRDVIMYRLNRGETLPLFFFFFFFFDGAR